MVIDDGDSPPDQEQEQLPADPHSDLAKSQDAQPIALAQSPGLPSRLSGQLSGDPGRVPMGVGEGRCHNRLLMLVESGRGRSRGVIGCFLGKVVDRNTLKKGMP